MKKIKPVISIVIVFFKGQKLLGETLASIYDAKSSIPFEVIVVDNGNTLQLEKKLLRLNKFIRYIKSPGNVGYGAGNNLGVKNSLGKYLFILNPDVKLCDNTLDLLLKKLRSSKKLGAVSPIFYDENGREVRQIGTKILSPLSGIFVLSFLNKLFPQNIFFKGYWDFSGEFAEVLPGSAFLISKKLFMDSGMFDEKMFLFFEEFDLFKRVGNMGYKFAYEKKTKIYHRWSMPKLRSKELEKYFKESRFYFFKKHYGLFPAVTLEFFVRISKKGFKLANG